jgi:hypothetical protein
MTSSCLSVSAEKMLLRISALFLIGLASSCGHVSSLSSKLNVPLGFVAPVSAKADDVHTTRHIWFRILFLALMWDMPQRRKWAGCTWLCIPCRKALALDHFHVCSMCRHIFGLMMFYSPQEFLLRVCDKYGFFNRLQGVTLHGKQHDGMALSERPRCVIPRSFRHASKSTLTTICLAKGGSKQSKAGKSEDQGISTG